MAPQDRNNYFKLVAVIVDIACLVIWKFIENKILGSDSFETFLNREKHQLVHLYETCQCCQCVSEKIKGEKLISKVQLLLLYRPDETKRTNSHRKYVGRELTQTCICNYSAIQNVDVKVVDFTMAFYLIQIYGKREKGADNWIKQIQNLKKQLFHLSDEQEITDEQFNRKWTRLELCILGLARLIDNTYAAIIDKRMMQTKRATYIEGYDLKYEILCRDYWRQKCTEFERVQMQYTKLKSSVLQYNATEFLGGTMQTDSKRISEITRKYICNQKLNPRKEMERTSLE